MGRTATCLLAVALGVASLAAYRAVDHRAERPGVGAGADWLSHNADAAETAYSRLDKINASNVSRLGLAWSADLPGESSLEATPLAVGGVLYFTGAYAKVYAVDAVTGMTLWTFDPQTWKTAPIEKIQSSFSINRGVAYANGRIFSTAWDGRMFALDAKTGKLIWQIQTTEQPYQTVSGAPRVLKDKVIIGQGGADFSMRGYVAAYDQATGKRVWRFYVVPGSPEQNRGDPAMEKAAATWAPDFWKKNGGGGGPWNDITYDADLNRIYVGTANASPNDPDARSPGGGDNLYTASIIALDADTGKYIWHYQVNPRDAWDYDATQQITLADLVVDGTPRKVLMQAPKNGFLYVIDRTDGKLISADKIAKATWADRVDLATGRPVEAKNIRYESGDLTVWPGMAGAHSWQAQAFSPRTGLIYVPTMQAGQHFTRGEPRAGDISFGGLSFGPVKVDPADGAGALVAWDPVTRKPAWRAQHETAMNGGAMASAGGLVFQGSGDGHLYAYDAKSGKQLWKFYAGMGIIAPPMTFEVGGRQYVSVLAGFGGNASMFSAVMEAGWKYASPRRILTFALDGKAKLRPSPPRNAPLRPLDDPAAKLDPKDVAAGSQLTVACVACHGAELVSAGGPGPDLRESAIALTPDGLWSVLHDGALLSRGMPRFDTFSRDQVRQIWSYIRQRARDAKAAQSTSGPAKAS